MRQRTRWCFFTETISYSLKIQTLRLEYGVRCLALVLCIYGPSSTEVKLSPIPSFHVCVLRQTIGDKSWRCSNYGGIVAFSIINISKTPCLMYQLMAASSVVTTQTIIICLGLCSDMKINHASKNIKNPWCDDYISRPEDSIAVLPFVVILVEFDEYWESETSRLVYVSVRQGPRATFNVCCKIEQAAEERMPFGGQAGGQNIPTPSFEQWPYGG